MKPVILVADVAVGICSGCLSGNVVLYYLLYCSTAVHVLYYLLYCGTRGARSMRAQTYTKVLVARRWVQGGNCKAYAHYGVTVTDP